jgi:hypothetical protein
MRDLRGGGLRNDFAIEVSGNHVGEEQAAEFDIEWSQGGEMIVTHADSSKCLAAGEQFAIDGTDLVQELTESLIVGQIFCGLAVRILGNVIHLRPLSVATDREVVLGAVAGTTSAFAARFATRFVALDERTTKQAIERWHLPQKLVTATTQSNRSLFAQLDAHNRQSTYITGLPT